MTTETLEKIKLKLFKIELIVGAYQPHMANLPKITFALEDAINKIAEILDNPEKGGDNLLLTKKTLELSMSRISTWLDFLRGQQKGMSDLNMELSKEVASLADLINILMRSVNRKIEEEAE